MQTMEITINDHRKILAIQEEFSKNFPYLKLEFFSKPNKPDGVPSKKLVTNNNKTIGECRTIHTKGVLSINPQMKVIDLDQNFRDVYGLSVQVLRKSGKAWLEATITDGWTLEEQNFQGEALSKIIL